MAGLTERVGIITGASSGIGAATSRELAGAGMKLMLAARREDRLRQLQREIENAGGTASYRVTDVTQRQQVEALVDETLRSYGRLDVLFNNAGVMPLSALDQQRVADWDRMIDVNIRGVLYGVAAALPVMRRQGSGHIINTASVAGHKVFTTAAVYCATKHAVRAISEGIRIEVGEKIRCTIISPGAVKTELADDISDPDIKKQMEWIYEQGLDPEAIARAVRYAIEQPHNVDVNEILIRPTPQSL